jgi:hypothetical protein
LVFTPVYNNWKCNGFNHIMDELLLLYPQYQDNKIAKQNHKMLWRDVMMDLRDL